MKKASYTYILLITLVFSAVFGLYLMPMGHMGGMDCPFAPGSFSMCATPLAHLEHWQTALMATLIQLVLLVLALVVLAFFRAEPDANKDPRYERYRLRRNIPVRPPLFQELFSQGILNPRLFPVAHVLFA